MRKGGLLRLGGGKGGGKSGGKSGGKGGGRLENVGPPTGRDQRHQPHGHWPP